MLVSALPICSAVHFLGCDSGDSRFSDAAVTGDGVDGSLSSFSSDAGPPGADAFWANDPPPKWCGPTGSPPPVPPTGTLDCPSDKNREGCPCTKEGDEVACWPGLRKNRNLGMCKDGVATCTRRTENELAWGVCKGYVVPDANAKTGKRACMCFSEGEWSVKNTSPCVLSTGGQVYMASSSNGQCESVSTLPPPVPKGVFSEDTLQVDCEGHFKLAFAIKAGDVANPKASDCTVMKVTTEGDYPSKNQVKKFPDLPPWSATDLACTKKYYETGGYGEFSVIGKSWLCENIDNGSGGEYVFQRFAYCPMKCADPANATTPECVACKSGLSGKF